MAVSKIVDPTATTRWGAPKQALAQLSSEFSSWMDSECDRLDKARKHDIKAKLFAKLTCDALFAPPMTLKGEAATFGYPLGRGLPPTACAG